MESTQIKRTPMSADKYKLSDTSAHIWEYFIGVDLREMYYM
jgi:hypothetical protein